MQMDWEAVLKRWHNSALDDLTKTGTTPWMLHIYPEHSDAAILWVEPQGLSDEGRMRLRMMNAGFRITNPAAVLLSSDAWVPSDKFYERYGIAGSFEGFQKRYLEILNKRYKGSLEFVPRDLKIEAITTVIKGPRFLQMGMITKYHRENKKVVIDKTMGPSPNYMLNLVKDWWESVLQ